MIGKKGQVSNDGQWIQGYVAFLGFIVIMTTLGAPFILDNVPESPTFPENPPGGFLAVFSYIEFAIGSLGFFFSLLFVSFVEFPIIFSLLFLPLLVRLFFIIINLIRG